MVVFGEGDLCLNLFGSGLPAHLEQRYQGSLLLSGRMRGHHSSCMVCDLDVPHITTKELALPTGMFATDQASPEQL